jgi:hypothetical protein
MNSTPQESSFHQGQATFLDLDNQPISNGLVDFYRPKRCGRFWPKIPLPSHMLKGGACVLRFLEGDTYHVLTIDECKHEPHSKKPQHFDFACQL